MTRRAQGFTLIELLIVVACALILITIGVSLYQRFMGGANSISATSGLNQIVNDAQALFRARPFTGLSACVLVTAGKGPDDWRSGCGFRGGWGGAVAVRSATYDGPSDNAIEIELVDVPREECNNIVASTGAIFQRVEIGASSAGGAVVKDLRAATPIFPSSAAIVAACNRESSVMKLITV